MTHGSLFSGIGGFDLAAQWCGWENKFHCEWNEFGQKILKHYWPQAESYGDITWTDFTKWRGQIDVLSGGFPCQPFSVAGKRLGTEDSRHLWPEMLRAIREIRPLYVVGENVRGILSWDEGVVFEQVHLDLEAEGYEVIAFVLPACGVNAPHRRERTWFIAHRNSAGLQTERTEQQATGAAGSCLQRAFTDTCVERCNNGGDNRKERYLQNDFGSTEENKSEWDGGECGSGEVSETDRRTFTDTTSERREEWLEDGRRENTEETGAGVEFRTERFSNVETSSDSGSCGRVQYDKQQQTGELEYDCSGWDRFPTQSPVCGGDDGLSSRLDFTSVFAGIPFPRRPITFAKWRSESIKAYGNAIVPQVAYEIFKVINQLHR